MLEVESFGMMELVGQRNDEFWIERVGDLKECQKTNVRSKSEWEYQNMSQPSPAMHTQ